MFAYFILPMLTISALSVAWIKYDQRMTENDWADSAAAHLAQYTQAAASRMFEMGGNFVVAGGYAAGTPPAAGSLWLKNPATCSLSGIPTLPNDELGVAVDNSFVPCDFSDTNIYGHGYTTTWTTVYPGTRMIIQVGPVPFTANGGERRGDLGGHIATRAQALSSAGQGDSTLDVMIRYNFDPVTDTLTAVVDRSSPFASDPHLRIDGTIPMDAAAPIAWGNGMSITPNGTAMDLAATGGVNVLNNARFDANVDLPNGDITVSTGDIILDSVRVDGAHSAALSRAVFDQRINMSGDIVNKITCPTGSTAQIMLAPGSVPTGSGMQVIDSSGSTITGDILRHRPDADDLGSQWQVWIEVYIRNRGWTKLASSEADMRTSIKCT